MCLCQEAKTVTGQPVSAYYWLARKPCLFAKQLKPVTLYSTVTSSTNSHAVLPALGCHAGMLFSESILMRT